MQEGEVRRAEDGAGRNNNSQPGDDAVVTESDASCFNN